MGNEIASLVMAEGLDLVREGLAEVQQKMASVRKTVYGSEVVKGGEVVLSGFAQAMLNGCKGYVKEWDANRYLWVVKEGSK